jgi:hypothetical protein
MRQIGRRGKLLASTFQNNQTVCIVVFERWGVVRFLVKNTIPDSRSARNRAIQKFRKIFPFVVAL